ncbi:hypothetical protein DENSPDRAFT_844016 [Dentipellis sp. KUC8613]|nr:hypothetical protein DENSPDRAFT_844016 [Dentipellis sp. KUC8613]
MPPSCPGFSFSVCTAAPLCVITACLDLDRTDSTSTYRRTGIGVDTETWRRLLTTLRGATCNMQNAMDSNAFHTHTGTVYVYVPRPVRIPQRSPGPVSICVCI